ncbi:sensor histidine kinase [Derxia lacustris]|uniref:sensor histidine kinase n=1 Tax=Derxia lacustris TaxID=764842 RepID=UPI000A16FB76|nr:histidine kinase [Derxia lacustris]
MGTSQEVLGSNSLFQPARQPAGGAQLTLKLKLTLMVVGAMLALMLATSVARLLAATHDTLDEVRAATDTVYDLLPARLDAANREAALGATRSLMDGLAELRHVRVEFRSLDGSVTLSSRAAHPRPDGLLARLAFSSDDWPSERHKPVLAGSTPLGSFTVLADPGDELLENSRDYLREMRLLGLITLVLGALVYWAVSRAMRPLARVAGALGAIEQGQLGTRLVAREFGELEDLANCFNRTAGALQESVHLRQCLLDKLIAMEETTRRSIARDLHDELSPWLVAMRPHVVIISRCCADDPAHAGTRVSAEVLADHLDRLLRRTRDLLEALHPPELQSLGLEGALGELLRQRRLAAPRELRIDLDFGLPQLALAAALETSVYRIVQESVTNAFKHSDCGRIAVRIAVDAAGSAIDLRVWNDGNSYGQTFPASGYGVLGLRERALALGGRIDAGPGADGGWEVHAHLPICKETT